MADNPSTPWERDAGSDAGCGDLVAALLPGAIGAVGPAPGQPNDDIDALNRRVDALFEAARFANALPLAQRSVALTKAQHGEDDPQYALALTNLAGLLQATNRLAEAEPLFRGALAIDEKRLGSDHPDAGP